MRTHRRSLPLEPENVKRRIESPEPLYGRPVTQEPRRLSLSGSPLTGKTRRLRDLWMAPRADVSESHGDRPDPGGHTPLARLPSRSFRDAVHRELDRYLPRLNPLPSPKETQPTERGSRADTDPPQLRRLRSGGLRGAPGASGLRPRSSPPRPGPAPRPRAPTPRRSGGSPSRSS